MLWLAQRPATSKAQTVKDIFYTENNDGVNIGVHRSYEGAERYLKERLKETHMIQVGEFLNHTKFGVGRFMERVGKDKIEVVFNGLGVKTVEKKFCTVSYKIKANKPDLWTGTIKMKVI